VHLGTQGNAQSEAAPAPAARRGGAAAARRRGGAAAWRRGGAAARRRGGAAARPQQRWRPQRRGAAAEGALAVCTCRLLLPHSSKGVAPRFGRKSRAPLQQLACF